MQRCWDYNHFTRWQGKRGKIVSLATSGPSAFHANAEKIHMPLLPGSQPLQRGGTKSNEGKSEGGEARETGEKRKRKGVGKKDGDNMSSQQLVQDTFHSDGKQLNSSTAGQHSGGERKKIHKLGKRKTGHLTDLPAQIAEITSRRTHELSRGHG